MLAVPHIAPEGALVTAWKTLPALKFRPISASLKGMRASKAPLVITMAAEPERLRSMPSSSERK